MIRDHSQTALTMEGLAKNQTPGRHKFTIIALKAGSYLLPHTASLKIGKQTSRQPRAKKPKICSKLITTREWKDKNPQHPVNIVSEWPLTGH